MKLKKYEPEGSKVACFLHLEVAEDGSKAILSLVDADGDGIGANLLCIQEGVITLYDTIDKPAADAVGLQLDREGRVRVVKD